MANDKCEQQREDCFAYYKGFCDCLADTHFNKTCPFYKPKAALNIPTKPKATLNTAAARNKTKIEKRGGKQ